MPYTMPGLVCLAQIFSKRVPHLQKNAKELAKKSKHVTESITAHTLSQTISNKHYQSGAALATKVSCLL